jgi:tRNA dimethylallyltransferase
MLRIFIIGTTAVGKTKLSVALAKHIQGEIVSCDSKQLYRHASIMTAKVTEEEAEGVRHHMVDCLDLEENAYNRNKYYKEAMEAVRDIEERQKSAVIVGGTNYYIETLLYNLKTLSDKAFSEDSEGEEAEMLLHVDREPSPEQQK